VLDAYVADFLFAAASDAGGIDGQLRLVAETRADRVRADVEAVWEPHSVPAPARELCAQGAAGADTLWRYWSVAIEPHWREIRAVLEDDVAYRAGCAALRTRSSRHLLGSGFADPDTLCRARPGRAEPGRAALGRAALGRAALGRAALGRAAPGRAALGRSRANARGSISFPRAFALDRRTCP
jgi:hypothetical protein